MSGGLEIAIVGMAGRFPGARNVAELWNNLVGGVESIERLSDEQLRESGVEARLASHPSYVRAHASLKDVDLFDAELFGFTPQEAAALDPQHRVFLECVWEAFENAGYDPEQIGGRVGVYAGSSFNGYLFHHFPDGARVQSAEDLSALLALDKDFLATRVSYKLNLRGPSIAVQTACSTSLVAVHLACQALLLGECEYALAGGVSINVPQAVGYLYQEGGIASPDGHCRAFDANARGTVAGSGAGVVLLKRLDDARADGDSIIAVIKGSAINNDGRGKAGFTAPSVAGQAKVIRDAHAAADVAANTIGYVEAHGTGTPLGDPIEVTALTRAFASSTHVAANTCALGSLKTNIGHLDAAAGIAGLVKASLALAHRTIPKSLHFEQPNPAIDFANSPFYVANETRAFPALHGHRRAAVSSFGVGGTNAHVVLEEAERSVRKVEDEPQLLVLSARSGEALQAYAEAVAERLESDESLQLSDVAHTLQVGRRAFPHRRALLCTSREDAVRALRSPVRASVAASDAREVAFLFPGQGSQRVNAGRGLYESNAVFRAEVDSCAKLLESELHGDLRRVLFPEASELAEAEAKLARTSWTQPALFVLEYALARALEAAGVRANAFLGHSVGEYVAACLAGTFQRDDALRVVAARGRLMEATPEGAMLAVAASEAELHPLLEQEQVALAAVNAAKQCVLAGSVEAIERCEQVLAERSIQTRRLRVARAFHSSLMDGALAAFRAVIARVKLATPSARWVSNVSGRFIEPHQAVDPDYWVQQLRNTVRFADGLETLRADNANLMLLEVGPGESLSRIARATNPTCTLLPDANKDDTWLSLFGRVWSEGAPLDLRALLPKGRRVALPGAALERKRYWLEPRKARQSSAQQITEESASPKDWFYEPSWRRAPAASSAQAVAGRWLVLAEAQQGKQLCTALQALGEAAVSRDVTADDLVELLRKLKQDDELPTHFVHAVAWTTESSGAAVERLRAAVTGSVQSLLMLGRALAAAAPAASLIVLAENVHEVTGTETLRPEHAPLHPAVRTLATEYPNLRVRLIDVEAQTTAAEIARKILDEARSNDEERVVAYRGSYRWLPTVARRSFPEHNGEQTLLRQRGTYLITGGLGGVGLEIAELLARKVSARLVLVGRSTPNDAQRARLVALEQFGAEVLVCPADVADDAAMRTVVADARARFGAIHGAIHAAANSDGALIETLTRADLERSFRAKAFGALTLCDVLAAEQLDFVLLCSSLSALSGGVAQVGYAAANAFLDAFACVERRRGRPVISVDFDRFDELGMALAAEKHLAAFKLPALSRAGIARTQVAPMLELLFGELLPPHVIVSTRTLQGLPKDDVGEALAARLRGATQGSEPQLVAVDASLAEILDRLREIWARAFGVADVAPDQDFYALGGESLLALQILNRVRDAFAVEIPLRELFEQRTPTALARVIQVARTKPTGESSEEPQLVALPRRARRVVDGGQG